MYDDHLKIIELREKERTFEVMPFVPLMKLEKNGVLLAS